MKLLNIERSIKMVNDIVGWLTFDISGWIDKGGIHKFYDGV